MPQTNPKRTKYNINNDAGAFTVIRLTCFAIYVEIDESLDASDTNAGVKQGLQYNALDPFAQSGNITAGAEPTPPDFFVSPVTTQNVPEITFGDKHNIHSATNQPLGGPGSAGNIDVPGGRVTLGTPILQVRSNTATATTIIVTEYN